jgi:dTDP-glucose pyrophosphorylase
MEDIKKHCINQNGSVREALTRLNDIAPDSILFVVENNYRLVGSLTDGDLRRGFINNFGFDDSLLKYIQPNPISIRHNSYSISELENYRNSNIKIIPILDDDNCIIDILNFRNQTTIIPMDALLMAGGIGKRLLPLTLNTPKPLLKIGSKPIIEYNVERLKLFGVKNINISINYLGEQIEEYFNDGKDRGLNIKYVKENLPLGTVGSIHLVEKFHHETVLIMNSDLLTNIDFADFYNEFLNSNADMAVASKSYNVDIPYAVLEVKDSNEIISLKEKPRYSYFSNAGIYLIKKSVIDLIPQNKFYDITELIELLLNTKKKVITFPITGYWLDIGKHEDFKRAQEDIKHINF